MVRQGFFCQGRGMASVCLCHTSPPPPPHALADKAPKSINAAGSRHTLEHPTLPASSTLDSGCSLT